jgi:hypothetical protein
MMQCKTFFVTDLNRVVKFREFKGAKPYWWSAFQNKGAMHDDCLGSGLDFRGRPGLAV